VQRTAHSVKGASASLGTERVGKLALKLEAQAATGRLDEAPDLYRQLGERFAELSSYLAGEFPELA
jgi:HPt (histidine-containing phosphotransfer) domain-containing protein